MSGALVNYTLSNLSSGVTQQYQEGRFDSQVSSMDNCIPNLTRGVLRRNPLNTRGILPGLPADVTDAFVYSYDRGTGDEQYMITVPGNGYMYVHNVNDGTLKYTSYYKGYLYSKPEQSPKEMFRALTIGDTTFIINNKFYPQLKSDLTVSRGYSDMAFYWIKKTASVVTEQVQTGTDPILSGSLLKGYRYDLNGVFIEGATDTRPGLQKVNLNTGPELAEKFVSTDFIPDKDGNPTTFTYTEKSLATKFDKAIAYDDNFLGTDWSWGDSFGDQASLGVWKTIDSSNKLPINLPIELNGFIVRVTSGTSEAFDDYFLKYDYDNKSWVETTKPGVKYKLEPTSMPHALYRLSDGSFTLDTFQTVSPGGLTLSGTSAWGERVVGGEEAIEDPSFIDNPIVDIFFFRNRLGFLTKDNIILSQTGGYGDFFLQTIQDTLDDDAIDLAVASTDVTVLRHAVPTAGQLIIFSDDTQFVLKADTGPLTVNTAEITALSNYSYGKEADARAIGNKIYFSSKVGGYNQMYAYNITDRGQQLTEAINLSLHLPTYLDNSITKIVGHSVLGLVFMQEANSSRDITVLSHISRQQDELQRAFHKWSFPKPIVNISIINNDLYVLFNDGDLCYMSLEIPGNVDAISYTDTVSTGVVEYTSGLQFSEFFFRDGKGKGTVRGRLQLRTLQYTIEDFSKYQTEIVSKNQALSTTGFYGPIWTDAGSWDDTLRWLDIDPLYTRVYVDDDKVTVMGDAKKVDILFRNNTLLPTKGFVLSTVNIEAFFNQRSQRT